MKLGIYLPTGTTGEFHGWDAGQAWQRVLGVARLADRLGLDSIAVGDHLHSITDAVDSPSFESFAVLNALAPQTQRVRLGHRVMCVGFRNPALVAKMVSSLDVISGGRAELAVGAGWYEPEWRGYGYGFPTLTERLEMLGEALEIFTRMLQPGQATWYGKHWYVESAISEPKGVQSRIPLAVGGNGPQVTWRLAARFADELDLDHPALEDIPGWMATARRRCEEIGRHPESLRISAALRLGLADGHERIDALGTLAQLGLHRVHVFVPQAAASDDPIEALVADWQSAGLTLWEQLATEARPQEELV